MCAGTVVRDIGTDWLLLLLCCNCGVVEFCLCFSTSLFHFQLPDGSFIVIAEFSLYHLIIIAFPSFHISNPDPGYHQQLPARQGQSLVWKHGKKTGEGRIPRISWVGSQRQVVCLVEDMVVWIEKESAWWNGRDPMEDMEVILQDSISEVDEGGSPVQGGRVIHIHMRWWVPRAWSRGWVWGRLGGYIRLGGTVRRGRLWPAKPSTDV